MATAPQRFSEFLAFLEATLTEEMRSILPLVMKRYNSCSRPFKNSEDMLKLLTATKQDMEKDRRHMFIYLKDFLSELTAYQERERKLNELKRKRDSDSNDSENNSSDELKTSVSKKSKTCHKSVVKQSPIHNVLASDSISNPITNSNSKPVLHNGLLTLKKEVVQNQTNLPEEEVKSQSCKAAYRVENEVYICLSSSDEAEDGSENVPFKADSVACAKSKDLPNGEMSSTSKSVVTQQESIDRESSPIKNTLPSTPSTSSTPKLMVVLNRTLPNKDTTGKTTSEGCSSYHSGSSKDLDHMDIDANKPATPSASSDDHDKECNKKKEVSEKHIRKLEKLLGKLRNEIEKSRNKELSVDDLDAEDSSYIYEDRLEKKFVAAWKKLCDLKKRTTKTGRPTERHFTYSGTRYPEINKKIERLVNKKKIFPDYFDIRNIFRRVNQEQSLQLSASAVASLSKETFADVGNILQQRRHEDFVSLFGSKQTEAFRIERDPALFDKELKRKLDENRQTAKTNLAKVISKYADMEYNIVDKEEEVTSDAESSDEVDKAVLNEPDDGDKSDVEDKMTANHNSSNSVTSKHLTHVQSDPQSPASDTNVHAKKTHSNSATLANTHSVDFSSEDVIQPRSTDKNIWPSPIKVTPVTMTFDAKKAASTENVIRLDSVDENELDASLDENELNASVDENKLDTTAAHSEELVIEINDESQHILEDKSLTNKLPAEDEMLVINDDTDIQMEPSITSQTSMDISVDENNIDAFQNNKEPILHTEDENDHNVEDQVLTNKISEENEVLFQNINDDGNIQLKLSSGTETTVDKSANERKVDASSENKKSIAEEKILTNCFCTNDDEVLVLDDDDEDSDVNLKESLHTKTSKDISINENKVDVSFKNKKPIVNINKTPQDKTVNKISTDSEVLVLDDDDDDVDDDNDNDVDDLHNHHHNHSKIDFKPSLRLETSKDTSSNEKEVDVNFVNNKLPADNKTCTNNFDDEVLLLDDDDDGDGDRTSKTISVNENAHGANLVNEVLCMDIDEKNSPQNHTVCKTIPAANISGNSNVKTDLKMLKDELIPGEQSFSHMSSTDCFKDVSSSENVNEKNKQKIQFQIPEHLLKKPNQEGDDNVVQVESQLKVSGIKYDVAICGSEMLSTPSDGGKVNKVSSSNIPVHDDDDDENDVILVSSYFEESDDDVIILSD